MDANYRPRLATTDRRHFPAITKDVDLDLMPHPPR